MIDDGVGIPESLHDAIFEPRVTSKLETMVMDSWGVHGRGMALFSVRSNVDSIAGRLLAAAPGHGRLRDLGRPQELPERADQSSWPVVERSDAGGLDVVRGPHNIVRRVLEFACEHPELDVYLRLAGRDPLDHVRSRARRGRHLGPALLRRRRPAAGLAASCRRLRRRRARRVAESIGLSISERTAHRILAGELAPLETVLRQADARGADARNQDPTSTVIGAASRSTTLISPSFKRDLTEAFDALAEKYYLHLKGEPRIHVGRDEIRVKFDVDKEE